MNDDQPTTAFRARIPADDAPHPAPGPGGWELRLAVDNSKSATFIVRRAVAAAAATCAQAYSAMEAIRDTSPASVLMRKPEFIELCRGFAEEFADLTEAVDRAERAGVAWRDLVPDGKLVAALDTGIAAEKAIIRSRAYAAYTDTSQP